MSNDPKTAEMALAAFERLGFKVADLDFGDLSAADAELIAAIVNTELARDGALEAAAAAQRAVDALYRLGLSGEPCALPDAHAVIEQIEQQLNADDGADDR